MDVTAKEINGGHLMICSGKLPDEVKEKLLEKWENVNDEGEIDDLIAEAEAIASPKAYIKALSIDEIGEDYVVLSGVRFDGALLAERFSPEKNGSNTVYAHLATCGREVFDWFNGIGDVLLKSVADDICLAYLGIASEAVRLYARENYFKGRHFPSLNPGSLGSWPLPGQAPLFEVMGEGAVETGVTLTESYLMLPFKSGSGIYFASVEDFESCMLCDHENCPNRRAPRAV